MGFAYPLANARVLHHDPLVFRSNAAYEYGKYLLPKRGSFKSLFEVRVVATVSTAACRLGR
jgi:hypothetical protein